MPALPTFQTIFGLAKESVYGTVVAPTTSDQFFTVSGLKSEDVVDEIVDTGYRGLATMDYASYQGFRFGKLSWDCHPYPIPLGGLLMAIFGADGFAAGTTHPFTVAAGRTPSYTATQYYGVSGSSARQYAGHVLESLSLSYTGQSGLLKVSAVTMGKASPANVLAAKPTAVFDASLPFLPWQNAATINNVSNQKLIALDWKAERVVEVVPGANNTQDPTDTAMAGLRVTGKMTFVPTDDTEYGYYTAGTSLTPNSFLFTSGSNTLTITMTQLRLLPGTVIDTSIASAVRVVAPFRAVYNATDGGPAKATLVGGKSGAAY